MTREECESLMRECKNSWISYENPIAKNLITRMATFVYGNNYIK